MVRDVIREKGVVVRASAVPSLFEKASVTMVMARRQLGTFPAFQCKACGQLLVGEDLANLPDHHCHAIADWNVE